MTLYQIETWTDLESHYDTVLCDVWGVLHNGVAVFDGAIAALKAMRAAGKTVVLVTNSPRLNTDVTQQLDSLGADAAAWDGIVTSGDVTRTLIADGPRRVFHLGPDRDLTIYDGLDTELVDDFDAAAIACTGLFDDETETPDDYAEMLQRFRARDLPFICANPDIVVERGDRLIWCAGALAREYALMGGRTMIAGKPHRPIYERALSLAQDLRGQAIDRARVLAIGDGLTTDIKGAMDAGLDHLFIHGGIHAREYAGDNGADLEAMATVLDDFGATPVAVMQRLA